METIHYKRLLVCLVLVCFKSSYAIKPVFSNPRSIRQGHNPTLEMIDTAACSSNPNFFFKYLKSWGSKHWTISAFKWSKNSPVVKWPVIQTMINYQTIILTTILLPDWYQGSYLLLSSP